MEKQRKAEAPRVTLDVLLDKVDSKYTLVVLAARRARQLVDGAEPVIEPRAAKPVTVALEELAAGKLSYVPGKAGIK
ncbi:MULTISPECIES: DNA-directed RNA polymerase subunit omega [Thermaerobacter]|uniref:DNA-directed RNA polymerase subunit omega n=1 Tax=Thermaerobacter subterraneus DSM 13965 TaxID=867903 RepID=K6PLJ1_9FIRM|nr:MULTISPECIES: DNA-directed RNA polymerase subunit omega [Thermaerobacter]EKP93742.1 DNA-directed RNA polymerase subunit omega [Thermaerobacter subterraneus DSM 13965]QIA26887.1 DNA-directed RNA polymerase subunit omega [Thermaerobacter sp. PB12/4term]